MIRRFISNEQSQQNLTEELNIIKQITVINGYDIRIIDNNLNSPLANQVLQEVYQHTKEL